MKSRLQQESEIAGEIAPIISPVQPLYQGHTDLRDIGWSDRLG
jgi:hypothetical protein